MEEVQKSALVLQTGYKMYATRSSRLALKFAAHQTGHALRRTSVWYLLDPYASQIGLAHCQQKAENKQWKNPQYYLPRQLHVYGLRSRMRLSIQSNVPTGYARSMCSILILIELHVDINRRHGCPFACPNPIRQLPSPAQSGIHCRVH